MWGRSIVVRGFLRGEKRGRERVCGLMQRNECLGVVRFHVLELRALLRYLKWINRNENFDEELWLFPQGSAE